MPDFSYENEIGGKDGLVAGVDEAGRGPLAGPVVAAAVLFTSPPPAALADLIDDSKKMTAANRARAFRMIQDCASYRVAAASAKMIDEINILQATFLAMRRAVERLPVTPDHVLIDGNKVPPDLEVPATAVVKGDGKSISIAAASILAKVTRDRIMLALDPRYPEYRWGQNKGYGSKSHRSAVWTFGVTPHHRLNFRIKQFNNEL